MIDNPNNVLSGNNIYLSFIIPAYNEEKYIESAIFSINKYYPSCTYEIIVVDNGSTDKTVEIADTLKNVTVILCPNANISKVRNKGVAETNGKILIFLDSDILLTELWQKNIAIVLDELDKNPMMVTGSRCLTPDTDNWLIKNWFKRLVDYDAPYVNSGHLITSRVLFEEISGFTETLETAEDYDFCMKAKSKGASILNRPEIPVIHLGYPESYRAFIQRERWHGKQDFADWESFFESKIAWIAVLHLSIFILLSLLAILTLNSNFILIYLLLSALISIAVTVLKFRLGSLYSLLKTALIFYLYIWGRSLSLVDRLKGLIL